MSSAAPQDSTALASRTGPLLPAAAWAVWALAIGNVFLRFRSGSLDGSPFFNADILYLPSLYRDLIEEGGRFAGWRLTPAPYFIPDMLVFFALNAALGSFVHATWAYGVAQVLLLTLALQWLTRTVAPQGRSRAAGALAVLLISALVLLYANGKFPVWIYTFISGFHMGTLITALVTLTLFVRIGVQGSQSNAERAAFAIACGIGALSDALFLVVFTLPVVMLLGLLSGRRVLGRRLLVTLGLGAVGGSVAGYLLARIITGGRAAAGHMTLRSDDAIESLRRLGRAVDWMAQTQMPWVAAAWCIAVVWGARCLTRFLRARDGRPPSGIEALWAFTFVSLGANAASVVLTGQFHDAVSFRYLLIPLFLPVFLLSALPASTASPTWSSRTTSLALGITAVAWAIETAADVRAGRLWGQADTYPPLVACLDENKARYGLERGISDYWNAKHVSMFSRTGLRVVQVTHEGDIYHHINNIDWYQERRPSAVAYTFLLPARLDTAALVDRFGPPVTVFECPGSAVWLYERDRFDPAVRARFAARD